MKEFNLEEAKAGKSVCTRDGRKVRIICYDFKNDYPIIALIEDDGSESAFNYTINGEYKTGRDNEKDLMMVGEKKEGWINIYKGDSTYWSNTVFRTKELAIQRGVTVEGYVTTTKIEWEE